jgi:hypothetical protein
MQRCASPRDVISTGVGSFSGWSVKPQVILHNRDKNNCQELWRELSRVLAPDLTPLLLMREMRLQSGASIG